ncbi:hypothetical protein BHE90_016380 [Fusarium euwallaceae]|uniref:Uncharacterized protein n=1 Tax=Fusarium euwallaceae TaxID=1147111 RepID=A0A430L0K1_9HYPO|nr:hypothetical protein BHE90_016380 [Fusarium euwallaceae]
MDPNLELYRSILRLPPWERRERMGHLLESELDKVTAIIRREKKAQRLEESIAGRDLVEVALTDLSKITKDTQLQYTLLGRTIYSDDDRVGNRSYRSIPSPDRSIFIDRRLQWIDIDID